MSDDQETPPRRTGHDLSTASVLGLNGPTDSDWARLRGLQYAPLPKISLLRAIGGMVLALFVARIYMDAVPLVWLAAWLSLLAIVQVQSVRVDRSLADVERRRVTRGEYFRQALTSLLAGLVWSGAILGFAQMGTTSDMIGLFLIVALLAVGSIILQTTAPLGMVLLCGVMGLSTTASLALQGLYPAAIAAALLFTICSIGAIEVSRTQLQSKIAQHSIAEKDQVVSLLLREFEENEADWLWEVDTSRRLRSVSPRFAFALGCDKQQAEGKALLELIAGSNWEDGKFPASLHDLAEHLKRRENFSNLMVRVKINGEGRWWELSGTPMRDERGKFVGFRGVGSDVTEARDSSEKIAYLARYDTLTSLPNRMMLNEALGDALKYAEKWRSRCALMMVDLDRFKAVNDSLGHMTGDKMLAQVSARLQALMGENQMCGRLGGDEFAIVVRDASDPDTIRRLARQVIDSLSEPYQVDQHTLYVGASIGSAIGPRDGKTVEELMRNADLALYRAKDVGGGEHFQFEPVLHASAEERRQLEVSLREALNRDEMTLNFQPVVDARSEDVVSFEALVRWNSRDHGFVSPAKFIPLAEDTRLIVPIGKWVMRQACMEARAWPENVKINVNVSPEQLLEPEFSQDVVDALAFSGLRPERLEVEVTESIFMRDAAIARTALEKVMALGCSVALDDFGTGYSSLGYLRKLKFSTIKVDRTFVQGAAQNSSESLAIINAVVAMAKSLNMTTTAEGVETSEEAELIRNLGCDKIQGYYFGRPMTSEEARKIFLQGQRQIA